MPSVSRNLFFQQGTFLISTLFPNFLCVVSRKKATFIILDARDGVTNQITKARREGYLSFISSFSASNRDKALKSDLACSFLLFMLRYFK